MFYENPTPPTTQSPSSIIHSFLSGSQRAILLFLCVNDVAPQPISVEQSTPDRSALFRHQQRAVGSIHLVTPGFNPGIKPANEK